MNISSLTEFSQPFKKANISKIAIYLWYPQSGLTPEITGNIEYISNNTVGTQKFKEELSKEGFEKLLKRIDAFTNSMEG